METFKFDGLIVRFLGNAELLPHHSAGAQTRVKSTFCRSNNNLGLFLVTLRHFYPAWRKIRGKGN